MKMNFVARNSICAIVREEGQMGTELVPIDKQNRQVILDSLRRRMGWQAAVPRQPR